MLGTVTTRSDGRVDLKTENYTLRVREPRSLASSSGIRFRVWL